MELIKVKDQSTVVGPVASGDAVVRSSSGGPNVSVEAGN